MTIDFPIEALIFMGIIYFIGSVIVAKFCTKITIHFLDKIAKRVIK